MFETLQSILALRGPDAKAVVWAHNSHLGDARFTEMRAQGELNIGQLVRQEFGEGAYLVGFGTDRGTVAAASGWGGEMEIKQIRPALDDSYEHLCHEATPDQFLLPLRRSNSPRAHDRLGPERLERAIGVIYRPESERASHYFYASLPGQFDEWIWFDRTRAVEPLVRGPGEGLPDTFPFGT